jgi:hypothetical protein
MATRTWDRNLGTGNDMNNGANYLPNHSALLVGDDLVFDNTSVINATLSADLSVASITVASNYSGTINISGRTFTLSGNFSYAGAAFTASGTTVLNVGGNFTWSAASTNYGANGTINFTGTPVLTMVTGKTLGNCIFSNGATFTIAAAGSLALNRFKTTPNKTYTIAAGTTLITSTYTAGDWSGTAGNLVTFVSSVPGTGYTLTPSVNITASYMSITDATNNSATLTIDVSDGTSTRGMYTKDIKWPVDIFYQDPGRSDDTGDGLSMSTAKKTRQAVYNMLSNAGDQILIRRNTTETPTATLTYPTFANGTPSVPMKIIGFPRNSLSFTGTWVNNVNAIWGLSITADIEQHIGRWIKNNADGNNYLITDLIAEVNWDGKAAGGLVAGTTYTGQTSGYVWTCLYNIDNGDNTGKAIFWKWATASGRALFVDNDNLRVSTTTYAVVNGTPSLCFCIDRPYPGANATGVAGTIAKDEDYDWSQTLTSGQGADLLSTWTADADDVPILNWNGGSYTDNITRVWYEFRNLLYENSASSSSNLYNSAVMPIKILGCIFTSNVASKYTCNSTYAIINRCVIYGITNTIYGLYIGIGIGYIFNTAIHHVYNGLTIANNGKFILRNVNIGVEKESSNIEFQSGSFYPDIFCIDCAVGSSSVINGGHTSITSYGLCSYLYFQNFNKILNSHKVYIQDIGTIIKNDCSGGDVVARTGGAASVAEFLVNTGTYSAQTKAPTGLSSVGWCPAYIELKVWLNATDILSTQNFKFYVQSVTDALTSADLWLECEYIDSSTAQGYHKTIVTSSESITARSTSSDWTQFISTGNITVAAAGWVYLRIFCNKYSANKRYVDPMYDGAQVPPLWSMGQPMVEMQTQDFPLPANVLTIDTTNNVPGTFNEATRNTDPGIANVIKDVPYKIANSSLTGTFDEAARNSGTAGGNILTGNSIKIQNVTTNGSFTESDRNTDPGESNVKSGTSYKILNVAKSGSMSAGGGIMRTNINGGMQ